MQAQRMPFLYLRNIIFLKFALARDASVEMALLFAAVIEIYF